MSGSFFVEPKRQKSVSGPFHASIIIIADSAESSSSGSHGPQERLKTYIIRRMDSKCQNSLVQSQSSE